MRSALSVLGYDYTTYAGHSFRIGAATTAAERGIEESLIKILGGQFSLSAVRAFIMADTEVGVQETGGSGS